MNQEYYNLLLSVITGQRDAAQNEVAKLTVQLTLLQDEIKGLKNDTNNNVVNTTDQSE